MRALQSVAHSLPALGRSLRPAFVHAESVVSRLKSRSVAHLIHVGKTGGVALRYAVEVSAPSSTHTLRFWGHTFRLVDVPRRDYWFFFTRDPIDRFVSAFAYRAGKGTPLYPDPWSDAERKAFEKFPAPDALGRALYDDPDAAEAMRGIEHVRDSYERWFGQDRNRFVRRVPTLLMVGRQETLSDDVRRLGRLVGTELTLPTDDVRSHRTPDGVDRSLSSVARRNLARWYRSDFEFLDWVEPFR